jgi:hypothetical protein
LGFLLHKKSKEDRVMKKAVVYVLMFAVVMSLITGCASVATPVPTSVPSTSSPSPLPPTVTPEPTAIATTIPSPTALPIPKLNQVNDDGFGNLQNLNTLALVVFNNFLYAGLRNGESGVGLLRFDGDVWEDVTPTVIDDNQVGMESLVVHQGYLYGGTWTEMGSKPELWRTKDGSNWEYVFGEELESYFGEISHLFTFEGQVYATVWDWSIYYESPVNGLEIWRSSTGTPNSWERVVSGGFNDKENDAILSSAIYQNRLYVGTHSLGAPLLSELVGVEPFSGTGRVYVTNDGERWDQVPTENLEGLGYISALASFGKHLYMAGSLSGLESLKSSDNQFEEARVYRCSFCDGSDWELVFDGPFQNTDTGAKESFEVYDGLLYIVIGNRDQGVEIYRTVDGEIWEGIASDGINDSANQKTYWDNGMVVFENELYVGFDNYKTGTEVWTLSHWD